LGFFLESRKVPIFGWSFVENSVYFAGKCYILVLSGIILQFFFNNMVCAMLGDFVICCPKLEPNVLRGYIYVFLD